MTLKTPLMSAVSTAAAAMALASWSAGLSAADLNQVLAQDRQGTAASVRAAGEVEKLREKTDDIQADRQSTDRENRMLEHYRTKLTAQLERIETAAATLEKEREELRNVRIHIYPLMEEMHGAIRAFVEADKPFLKAERTARLANLEKLMTDPALTDAQKMDALLDAYQVEVSYGYTVGAESGTLENGELVDFLRVGRLGWFAVNDAKGTAYAWNAERKAWEAVGSDRVRSLTAAVKVASGVTPPDLMLIPAIPAAEKPLDEAPNPSLNQSEDRVSLTNEEARHE